MAAAMYETSVAKFTGYRLLATIGAAALWLWVSTTSGMPLVLVIGGAVLARRDGLGGSDGRRAAPGR